MSRRIPLYPHPPLSPQTRDKSPSEDSDFLPIRVRKTTPEPPTPSVAARCCHCSLHHSSPVQRHPEQSSQPPNTGLGHKNRLNTINVTASSTRHTKNISKSSSKRALETFDKVADDRPLKRRCLTFIDEDNMDWLKDEIDGIKESVKEIADHLRHRSEVRQLP